MNFSDLLPSALLIKKLHLNLEDWADLAVAANTVPSKIGNVHAPTSPLLQATLDLLDALDSALRVFLLRQPEGILIKPIIT
jgi:hypothetical protein